MDAIAPDDDYRPRKAKKTGRNGGKYSIETLPDGKKYVKADRLVVYGDDPEEWSNQLEDYINGKIRKGENVQIIAEDGDVLTLTERTAGKVSSMYRSNNKQLQADEYERKVNAGAHIDELSQTSIDKNREKQNNPDFGSRHGEFAKDGWRYRKAYFQDFDGKYYEVLLSVEIGTDGNAVYNIGEMDERSFLPFISGSSTESGATQGEKTSSSPGIRSKNENVNQKFSFDDDNGLEWTGSEANENTTYNQKQTTRHPYGMSCRLFLVGVL